MASQQVTYLLKGYLAGHLTFQYPNKYSLVREHLIVDHLKKEEMIDALRFRALEQFIVSAGQLASGLEYNHNQITKDARQRLRDLEDTAFPWLKQERIDTISKDDSVKAALKRLNIKKKQLDAQQRQPDAGS